MLGEIAAGWKLMAAAKEGFDALQALQPEYGRFWKKFEAELKPERRDLPWDRLKSLRVDPEFCGQACGLIRGDNEKRKAMRERITAIVTRPEGGRYDGEEIVERVMRAADESAVAAAKKDRDVSAQRGRMIEGELHDLRVELREIREMLLKLQPAPPDGAQEESRRVRRWEQLGYDRLESPVPRRFEGRAVSATEKKLKLILEHDPNVQALLPSTSLSEADLRYTPAFAVKDSEGTNWFVEVKSDAALRGPARLRLQRMADLTRRAARELSADWRFVLVTPSALADASSWSEVLDNAPDLPAA